MKSPPRTPLPDLERRQGEPLYRQIYRRFRDAIEQGLLAPGDRVASARSLASELGVARGTVDLAYSQLMGEGYFLARGQAGTVVSPRLPAAARMPRRPAQAAMAPAPGVAAMHGFDAAPPPFQLGMPALDAFPRKQWLRLAARRLRALSPADMAYGDPAGYWPLRQAIAAYLSVSRGAACEPGQVFVTAGHRASLALLARALLAPGDPVWVEEPGFAPPCEVLERHGCRLVPVPVDGEGLIVEAGRQRAPGARMALVTPSHQAPLGVSMSLARRAELLGWATQAGAWVVEDDYDGEYHYAGPPLPALKSLDAHDRVIYTGSFSKVLYPGLALAYLVAPAPLVQACGQAAATGSNGCSKLVQAIVADFMAEGHFSRHLKKMRQLYGRRRRLLAAALRQVFGDGAEIGLAQGGMHLIVRLPEYGDDAAQARRAQAAGLNAQPLSARYAGEATRQGLLLGFTNLASEDETLLRVRQLRRALDV
jgi:GntR family transcriptional regulator/MocR family aminotransferase